MEKWANKLAVLMNDNGMIENDDTEYYIYSIQIMLEKIIGYSVLLALSIVFKVFFQSIVFLLFFSWLRKFTNGLHLPTFKTCFIASISIYILMVNLIDKVFVDTTRECHFIFLCAFIVILYIGAVNTPNINWSYIEEKHNKFVSRIIVTIESAIIIASEYLEIDNSYVAYMVFGMFLCAVLLIIEKIRREMNER